MGHFRGQMAKCFFIDSISADIGSLKSCFVFRVSFQHEELQVNSIAFLLFRTRCQFGVEGRFSAIGILESSRCIGKKTATCSQCGYRCSSRYDRKNLRVRNLSIAGWRIYLEFECWRVRCPRCTSVHVEHLDWLAENPRYTQRFALYVGNLCRDMTVSRIAEIERLQCSTVNDLDKL